MIWQQLPWQQSLITMATIATDSAKYKPVWRPVMQVQGVVQRWRGKHRANENGHNSVLVIRQWNEQQKYSCKQPFNEIKIKNAIHSNIVHCNIFVKHIKPFNQSNHLKFITHRGASLEVCVSCLSLLNIYICVCLVEHWL